MDSGDKSSNKAMSVAFKYACFQALCIPTEEMKDPDGETPEQIKPKTPSPAPLICKECGEQIKGIKKGDAQFIAAEVSKRTSGLCYHCGVKHGIEL